MVLLLKFCHKFIAISVSLFQQNGETEAVLNQGNLPAA